MRPYLIIARFPKNPRTYIRNLKKSCLDLCLKKDSECVINRVGGRLLLFSSTDLCNELKKMKGIIDCIPVKIFLDEKELTEYVISTMGNPKSFAVRANRLHVAQDIGSRIFEKTRIPVNIENPEFIVEVEMRDEKFLLFDR